MWSKPSIGLVAVLWDLSMGEVWVQERRPESMLGRIREQLGGSNLAAEGPTGLQLGNARSMGKVLGVGWRDEIESIGSTIGRDDNHWMERSSSRH